MKHVVALDIEVYPNYFVCSMKNIQTLNVVSFELRDSQQFSAKDVQKIKKILGSVRVVTFNGRHYDIPILTLALKGFTPIKLQEASNLIILAGMQYWELERHYGFKIMQKLDHVDLIDVAPGQASLKIYGGRIQTKRMQDLPYTPGKPLSEEEIGVVRDYNVNDLNVTIDLYLTLKDQLQLRDDMSARYGIDLMSKSDAQIAEAVIKKEVDEIRGFPSVKPGSMRGTKFKYNMPEWVSYVAPQLKGMKQRIEATTFFVDEKGEVLLPDSIAMHPIELDGAKYRMGIGGLHSSEEKVSYRASDSVRIYDRDVTSYYPSIIMQQRLYPAHLGEEFLTVYEKILQERIAAKRSKNKVVSESLKIVVNGSFGKFGSRWSILYSPQLMIQVTLTGQLALLMLIDRLVAYGIKVVSANTDGIAILCHDHQRERMLEVIRDWETITGFGTEETEYSALYSRDVNNYIAVKIDSETRKFAGVKTKGAYAFEGLMKNPANAISIEAAIEKLVNNTDVAYTVGVCRDVRKFITIRQVKGGGIDQDGNYLGKDVRWYYSNAERDPLIGPWCIYYASNGNKVARSEGAVALMELPEENKIPKDLNRQWYVDEANSILKDIGASWLS